MKKELLIKIIIPVIVLLLAISYTIFFIYKPHLSLIGEDEILLTVNNQYLDPGIKATAKYKDISKRVVMVSNVNINKIGTYKVAYKITANHMTSTVNRTVKVVDNIKPTLLLIGGENVNICPNKEYVELGYTAIDTTDGGLTSKVKFVRKDNVITYTVNDSSGNIASTTRTLNITDIEKPILTLKGYQTVNIIIGNKYYESGYTVTDNCNDNLNDKVKVTNNVNVNQIGTYTVKYEVSDDSNNVTTVERIVKVVNPPAPKNSTIYLTFDDGPSSLTAIVLDILKEEGVKATFFILNRSSAYDYLLQRMVAEGHTIAVHGNTHNYSAAYASVDAYFNDITKIHDKILNITGVDTKILRFIGGSSNKVSIDINPGIMTTLTNEATNRGYHYFDWNVSSADTQNISSSQILSNVKRDLGSKSTYIVLQHDYEGNGNSVNAIRDIIKYGKANGYKFDRITEDTPPIHHKINN